MATTNDIRTEPASYDPDFNLDHKIHRTPRHIVPDQSATFTEMSKVSDRRKKRDMYNNLVLRR